MIVDEDNETKAAEPIQKSMENLDVADQHETEEPKPAEPVEKQQSEAARRATDVVIGCVKENIKEKQTGLGMFFAKT